MAYKTPSGTYDILPSEIHEWQETESVMKDVAKRYGYKEIRTPYFEDTSVFARENDSSDMVNKEMYSFQPGNHSYTLRPEGTAGVIRSFDEHKMYGNQDLPAKLFYMGAMFRHERPQKGRQRQFHQFGIENIGVKSPEIDAETISLGVEIVKKMGIQSVKVLLNTLGDDESRQNYRNALKDYFKPYLDELCGDCKRRYEQNPLRILDCKVDHDYPAMKDAPKLSDYLNEESKEYFDRVKNALTALNIPYEVDERLVRGLDYYTHTVFEVVSTREDAGAQSTIFAGGRYDHLVSYFGGPDLSGIGFAIGMERLIGLAKEDGKEFIDTNTTDVYVIGLGDVAKDVLSCMNRMREAGYIVEGNFVPRSLKSQFKSADRSQARYIVIIGEEEVKNQTVNVKNIETQTQETVAIDALVNQINTWEGK